MHRTTKLKLQDLNPHLMCALCGGYLIDATAIIECLHSFCRTCIIRYLETSKFCPICDVQVHKTKPHVNIRRDKTLQNLVYKLVPGLFQNEMKKRREFYAANPEAGPTSSLNASEERGEASQDRVIYTEDEKISLCLQHCHRLPPYKNGVLFTGQNSSDLFKECDRRFLLCPAGFTIGLIKKFVRLKFDLQPQFQIEVFHLDESLQNDYTLMDIAYIYAWRRNEPLKLYYIVYDNALRHTIKLPNPMQFAITAHKKSRRGRKRKHSPVEEKAEEEEEEECREEETEEDDEKMSMDEAAAHDNGSVDISCSSSVTSISSSSSSSGSSTSSSTSSKPEEGSDKVPILPPSISSTIPCKDRPASSPPAKSLKLEAATTPLPKETVPEAAAVAESQPVGPAPAASAAVAQSQDNASSSVAMETDDSSPSTSNTLSAKQLTSKQQNATQQLTNGHCANTGKAADAVADKPVGQSKPVGQDKPAGEPCLAKSMKDKVPTTLPAQPVQPAKPVQSAKPVLPARPVQPAPLKVSPKSSKETASTSAMTLLQSLSKGTQAKSTMLTSKLCANKTTLIITNRAVSKPHMTKTTVRTNVAKTNGSPDRPKEVTEPKVTSNGVTAAVSKPVSSKAVSKPSQGKTFSPISQISAHIEKTLTTMNATQKPSPNFQRLLEVQRASQDKMAAFDKSRAMQISSQKLEFTKRNAQLSSEAVMKAAAHTNGSKLKPGENKIFISKSLLHKSKEQLPLNKGAFSTLKDQLASNGPTSNGSNPTANGSVVSNGSVVPSANKPLVNGQKGCSLNNDVIITVDKPKVIPASLMEGKRVFSSALTTSCTTPSGPRSVPSFNSPLTTALLTPKTASSPEGPPSRAPSESGSETSGSPAEARMGAPSPPKDDNASPLLPNPTQNKPRKDLLTASKELKQSGTMSPYLRELKAMATQRREGAKVLKINGITTDLVLKSTKRTKPSPNSTDCLTPQRPQPSTPSTPKPLLQQLQLQSHQQSHQQQSHQQLSHQQQSHQQQSHQQQSHQQQSHQQQSHQQQSHQQQSHQQQSHQQQSHQLQSQSHKQMHLKQTHQQQTHQQQMLHHQQQQQLQQHQQQHQQRQPPCSSPGAPMSAPSLLAKPSAPQRPCPSPAHQSMERVATPVSFYHHGHHPPPSSGPGRGPSPALSPHSPHASSPHSPSNGTPGGHLRHISPPPVAQFFMRPSVHRPIQQRPSATPLARCPEANGYDAPLDFTTKKSPSTSSPPSSKNPGGQSSPSNNSPPNERTLLKVPNFTSLRT